MMKMRMMKIGRMKMMGITCDVTGTSILIGGSMREKLCIIIALIRHSD